MEKLEKLIRKRSSIRDAITKLSSELDNFIETRARAEAKEIDYFVELLEQLNAKDSSLNSLNSKIEASISDPNEYDKEINESEEFSESIVKSRIKIKKQIKLLEEKTVTSMQSTVLATHIVSPEPS
ncbi:hypothetical protein AVEN_7279-1 [Araneus ventricosus]|uniref:Uncharacterized protein n=1 Tax=Araneus ventricosus TaxID=182803 RepID=A0A4Y2I6E1_ARAVE|nr:hypothetical protein AVEN_7279-1 [Araneus ventricosus]